MASDSSSSLFCMLPKLLILQEFAQLIPLSTHKKDALTHSFLHSQANNFNTLKAVSATFLLVRFVCLKESTSETRKNVSYFTSKVLFVLEKIKF